MTAQQNSDLQGAWPLILEDVCLLLRLACKLSMSKCHLGWYLWTTPAEQAMGQMRAQKAVELREFRYLHPPKISLGVG